MQLNYYVLGQRIQKIRKNKRISQAVLSTMIDKSAGFFNGQSILVTLKNPSYLLYHGKL